MVTTLCAVALLTGQRTVDSALREVNAVRKEIGLPTVALDKRLSAVADGHSRYMDLNKAITHMQDPSRNGFTGASPSDRVKAAGMSGACFEVVSDDADLHRGLRRLFDAPTHRVGFLQPSPITGIGIQGRYLTIVFASGSEGIGLSPAASQKNVPTSWDGFDSPPPLPAHGLKPPVGYPIMFANFARLLTTIKSVTMSVKGPNGADVSGFVHTPANDPWLMVSAYFLPKKPLDPNTTYTVKAHAMVGDKPVDRTWSFTTGDR